MFSYMIWRIRGLGMVCRNHGPIGLGFYGNQSLENLLLVTCMSLPVQAEPDSVRQPLSVSVFRLRMRGIA